MGELLEESSDNQGPSRVYSCWSRLVITERSRRPTGSLLNRRVQSFADPQSRSRTWLLLLMPLLWKKGCHWRDLTWSWSSTLTRNFRKITTVPVRSQTTCPTHRSVSTKACLANRPEVETVSTVKVCFGVFAYVLYLGAIASLKRFFGVQFRRRYTGSQSSLGWMLPLLLHGFVDYLVKLWNIREHSFKLGRRKNLPDLLISTYSHAS